MNQLRHEAEKLRDQGYSYALINEKLGISKSTMSYWFKDKVFTPNKEVLERIKTGTGKVGVRRHNQRVSDIRRLQHEGIIELGKLSKRDLWLLGLGIYVGEGDKTQESIRITNANPAIIATSVKWLREICGLDSNNIVITLHLYPDTHEMKAKRYWQRVTGLPIENFRKTQIDKRLDKKVQRKGKLPHGTAHLRVISNGDPSKGVALYRKIDGWVLAALSQV